jgi:hypothetical protein
VGAGALSSATTLTLTVIDVTDVHTSRAVEQSVESVNQTFKDQLDLEQHDGRTPRG